MHVIVKEFPAFVPRAPGGGHVLLKILGVPGESLTHNAELAPAFELPEKFALTGLPAALDELHNSHFVSLPHSPQGRAEGGGGFALPVAGVDDDQSLFNGSLNARKFPRRFIDTSWHNDTLLNEPPTLF